MATYDIFIEPLPRAKQTAGRIFTFSYAKTVGIKGPRKLAMRFLKCLLTPKGSDLMDSEYGTIFPDLINSNYGDINDVLGQIRMAVSDCADQVKALDESAGLPSRERLSSATITKSQATDTDGVDVYVTLTNQAGERLVTLLPVLDTR